MWCGAARGCTLQCVSSVLQSCRRMRTVAVALYPPLPLRFTIRPPAGSWLWQVRPRSNLACHPPFSTTATQFVLALLPSPCWKPRTRRISTLTSLHWFISLDPYCQFVIYFNRDFGIGTDSDIYSQVNRIRH